MLKSLASDPRVAFRSSREVAIHLPDLGRAKEFYCDTLGFRLVSASGTMLEIDTGELRLFILHDPVGVTSYVPSFDVPDYQSARRLLEAAGCATVPAGSHPTNVYFRDPFGLVFDIVER
jgi:catechol 2,3-dioxygenase-like lactoylglutathione lyase family enzyme